MAVVSLVVARVSECQLEPIGLRPISKRLLEIPGTPGSQWRALAPPTARHSGNANTIRLFTTLEVYKKAPPGHDAAGGAGCPSYRRASIISAAVTPAGIRFRDFGMVRASMSPARRKL